MSNFHQRQSVASATTADISFYFLHQVGRFRHSPTRFIFHVAKQCFLLCGFAPRNIHFAVAKHLKPTRQCIQEWPADTKNWRTLKLNCNEISENAPKAPRNGVLSRLYGRETWDKPTTLWTAWERWLSRHCWTANCNIQVAQSDFGRNNRRCIAL